MLNLNGSLTKAGKPYSTLWSETFTDEPFKQKLHQWLTKGASRTTSPTCTPSFRRPLRRTPGPSRRRSPDLRADKAIMGIFDEGCMGMYNAIIPDELMFPLGVFKERLSQSALYAALRAVSRQRGARRPRLAGRRKGSNSIPARSRDRSHRRRRFSISARCTSPPLRIADDFGCDAIGIQYQQGLKDLMPASDLAEGMLNNDDRPPVKTADGKADPRRQGDRRISTRSTNAPASTRLFTNRVHRALGQPVETTLHDIRWGDADRSGTAKDYVWVFEISGAAPPAHHIGGWAGYRQPAPAADVLPLRRRDAARESPSPARSSGRAIFVEAGKLKMDLGRAHVVELPKAETERRWRDTTPQWPIMHAVLHGVSRDQMMARHKANHIQVAYANSDAEADLAMATKAGLAAELGLEVSICGAKPDGAPLLR